MFAHKIVAIFVCPQTSVDLSAGKNALQIKRPGCLSFSMGKPGHKFMLFA
jgi:hypothetical protein